MKNPITLSLLLMFSISVTYSQGDKETQKTDNKAKCVSKKDLYFNSCNNLCIRNSDKIQYFGEAFKAKSDTTEKVLKFSKKEFVESEKRKEKQKSKRKQEIGKILTTSLFPAYSLHCFFLRKIVEFED